MSTWIEADPSITAACDDESTRYALGGVQMFNHPEESERVIVAATDGRCLAVAEMSGCVEDSEPSLVPKAIFPKSQKELKEVGKAKGVRSLVSYDRENKEWRAPAYGRTAPVIDGRFPRFTEVMPHVTGRVLQLTIDPRLLAELAVAVGSNEEDRGVTLLIDIDSSLRAAESKLPDRATFRDDVRSHVLSHADKSGPLVIAVNPNGYDIETVDPDERSDPKVKARLEVLRQCDWIIVDSMPDSATPEEWEEVLWGKVYADAMNRFLHVCNGTPVSGNSRVGVIVPMSPDRKAGSDHDVKQYERIRKLAEKAVAAEKKRAGKKKPKEDPPAEAGPASDPPEDPPGDDDSDDQTSAEYGERHGNDMQLETVPDEPVPFDPPQECTGEPTVQASDPMAALMALAGL